MSSATHPSSSSTYTSNTTMKQYSSSMRIDDHFICRGDNHITNNSRDQLLEQPTEQHHNFTLPNISSFNYFHHEYAKPLTSEFSSFSCSGTSQVLRSEWPSSSSTVQSSLNNQPLNNNKLYNVPISSSTDSSSNYDSSSQSATEEIPLTCNNATLKNDSWHSNNSCNKQQTTTISSFDSSFQQALIQQEQNRSKKLDVLSANEIRQYFCYTQQDAARLLGVSVSTLKRRFYELKLGKRWPYKRTKQTPRKRKDTQGKLSEERQLIDEGIRACSNVIILTPSNLKHSPVSSGMSANTAFTNNASVASHMEVSEVVATSSSPILVGGGVPTREQTPPSTGNMSQQSTLGSLSNYYVAQQNFNSNGNIMISDQNIKKKSIEQFNILPSNNANSSGVSRGIEKQHKMGNKGFVRNSTSPTLYMNHEDGSTNRSRSSSNLSMSSSSVSSLNPNNQAVSSSNHSLQDERGVVCPPSSVLNNRNENSCKGETYLEQSRKKLSLSYIMNHSDTNSEQTS